jgi:hypothetical protein
MNSEKSQVKVSTWFEFFEGDVSKVSISIRIPGEIASPWKDLAHWIKQSYKIVPKGTEI